MVCFIVLICLVLVLFMLILVIVTRFGYFLLRFGGLYCAFRYDFLCFDAMWVYHEDSVIVLTIVAGFCVLFGFSAYSGCAVVVGFGVMVVVGVFDTGLVWYGLVVAGFWLLVVYRLRCVDSASLCLVVGRVVLFGWMNVGGGLF